MKSSPVNRIYRGNTTLPVPPLVGQNTAMLPDGQLDPDHATDCGEACFSSCWQALSGYYLSPGCIRQSLGPALDAGKTTAGDLAAILRGFGIGVDVLSLVAGDAWRRHHQLRRRGHYAISLGYWVGPNELHWMLFYEGDRNHVWAMDPWTRSYVSRDRSQHDAQYAGPVLWLH